MAELPPTELAHSSVRYSGFLSAFAISEEEDFRDAEPGLREELLKERDYLVRLAERGCTVRCIITPPQQFTGVPETYLNSTRCRVQHLIQFLQGNNPALENIEWAISPFRQKNLYIIGTTSCYEGFKQGVQRGFPFTLQQTGDDAIRGNISLYEALFKHVETYTLTAYSSGDPEHDYRIALRKAATTCLENAMARFPRPVRTTRPLNLKAVRNRKRNGN